MTFRQSAAVVFVSLVCLALGLAACGGAAGPEWHWKVAEAGLPRQAMILAVAGHPTDPNRIWAGFYAPGGLAFSRDGGQTWAVAPAGLADNPVFDLLFGPAGAGQGDLLWAATRDGLLRSEDGGASWQAVGGLPSGSVFALAADGQGRVFAGLDGTGVYAQVPGEVGWESLAAPLSPLVGTGRPGEEEPLGSAAVLALAVSADGQQLYAGTGGRGLFSSRDGGRIWSVAFPGSFISNVALNPAHPATAVASLRDRLIRTPDGGLSWQILPVAWAADEVVSLAWLADGTLGAGTGRGKLYRSQDGGNSWVEGGQGLPADGGVLALGVAGEDAPGGRRLLAGTWTGLYSSRDNGQTWRPLAPVLGTPHAAALLQTGTGLFLGMRAGLFRWQPGSATWEPAAAGTLNGEVQALAQAPSDRQILYAGLANGGLYRSDDGGQSWRALPFSIGIWAIAVEPADANHLYVLAAWERPYESRDGGQTWQARWTGLGMTTETASLAIDPAAPFRVYVGTEAGLYRRSRDGLVWLPAAPALAGQTVLAMATQPAPPDAGSRSILYLGATQGIYRSLDLGETVQQRSLPGGWGRGLEDISVTALLVDPDNAGRLYAGTAYAGIYQSLDWGRTWQAIGPAALADQVVEAMAWGPDHELFAAGPGGVWAGVER